LAGANLLIMDFIKTDGGGITPAVECTLVRLGL
jgi:hypothetical protein